VSSTVQLEQDSDVTLNKRRVLYGLTTLLLSVVIALGLVDALGWWHAYGVASTTVRASGGGYELEVQYGEVTRPALATPFEVTVTNEEGFIEPLVIAVSRSYLAMWDENGVIPEPDSQTVRGDWVEWEFEPPSGTTFTLHYDARIEPAVQWGRDGEVAIVVDDVVVVEVRFHTRVMP
jgi:hypothetical protein